VSIGTWREPYDSQRFAEEFTRFADRVGDRLPAERRTIYERLIEEGHRLNARYHAHRSVTIIQGDAHVWNVFLPEAGGDDLRLFDWDSWRVDVATDDLANMMALTGSQITGAAMNVTYSTVIMPSCSRMA